MQDKAIVQLGKLQLATLGNKKPYELFIQNMFPDKPNYDMILAVFQLKSENDDYQISFDKVDILPVNKNNYEKFAYRKGSARGGDITFTTKFGDIDKKFNTLVNGQFKALVEKLKKSAIANNFKVFNATYNFLSVKENYDEVKNQLSTVYESLSKDQKLSSGLTLKFIVDEQEFYLADFTIIQEILSASGTEEKSEKYNVVSEGKNQVCSICLEKKEVLHGFASPFKYATVDKPGMVSGFFNQKNNWKNYPICTDCSLTFELGRAYIANNLSSYFYGNSFYMIPKTLISKDLNKLKNATLRIKDIYENLTKDGQKIKQREDYIWQMIAKEETDYFNLNLLFYEENQTTKAIKIKLLLEEIVPSRFRKLFVEVPAIVNSNPLYHNAFIEDKTLKDLKFNFGILKTFFENDFYELIQKVFLLNKFSEDILYDKFMEEIKKNINKGYQPYLTILKAHLTLAYFRELNLIPKQLNKTIMEKNEQSITESGTGFNRDKISDILHNSPLFLDTDSKRGVFLLGVLVRHLLNVQSIELSGNTPFEKKLKGYQLNPDNLFTIYSMALGKLRDYRNVEVTYFPTVLLEYVDEYFLQNTNDIKKMSANESSFFFVAGTQLIKKLKNSDK
ncbi:CRISPR-associated protein Csh1 [Arcicella rosea]|uniref:TIGR02556 family CRISPR-associated protein n=1 Tax=Arcicella rosea TaxID=502909 RepID=UPI00345D351F